MSNQEFKFALNHMACPTLSPLEMLDMVAELGIYAVELRNDVRENSISDIDQAHAIAKRAITKGITVLSINALYPFNIWEDERAEQASHLAELASASGAQMLVCCPLVSADYDANDAERGEQLRVALRELRPILESKGLIGCIEPLGFPISTLRFKADAITAIHDIGGEGTFRLVHDTFHHRGAAETEMYASMTGLVHISGVENTGISFDEMLDAHRLFVGPADRLDSVGQVRQLLDTGYQEYISFEPFAEDLWHQSDPAAAIKSCMDFVREQLTI